MLRITEKMAKRRIAPKKGVFQICVMAEFEQALLADETTGDYAFQVIPGWVVDGEDRHGRRARNHRTEGRVRGRGG